MNFLCEPTTTTVIKKNSNTHPTPKSTWWLGSLQQQQLQHKNLFPSNTQFFLFELRNWRSAKKVNNTNGKLYQLFSLSQRAWIIIIKCKFIAIYARMNQRKPTSTSSWKSLLWHNCGWNPQLGWNIGNSSGCSSSTISNSSWFSMRISSIKWPEWLNLHDCTSSIFGWTLNHWTQPSRLQQVPFWMNSRSFYPTSATAPVPFWMNSLTHLTRPSQLHQFHFGWTL